MNKGARQGPHACKELLAIGTRNVQSKSILGVFTAQPADARDVGTMNIIVEDCEMI